MVISLSLSVCLAGIDADDTTILGRWDTPVFNFSYSSESCATCISFARKVCSTSRLDTAFIHPVKPFYHQNTAFLKRAFQWSIQNTSKSNHDQTYILMCLHENDAIMLEMNVHVGFSKNAYSK